MHYSCLNAKWSKTGTGKFWLAPEFISTFRVTSLFSNARNISHTKTLAGISVNRKEICVDRKLNWQIGEVFLTRAGWTDWRPGAPCCLTGPCVWHCAASCCQIKQAALSGSRSFPCHRSTVTDPEEKHHLSDVWGCLNRIKCSSVKGYEHLFCCKCFFEHKFEKFWPANKRGKDQSGVWFIGVEGQDWRNVLMFAGDWF